MLLAGTSGTGKSTLAGLLAARLGISTVLSTDSVRHMLRSFTPQAANPLLWASTYEVGRPASLCHVRIISMPAFQGTAVCKVVLFGQCNVPDRLTCTCEQMLSRLKAAMLLRLHVMQSKSMSSGVPELARQNRLRGGYLMR